MTIKQLRPTFDERSQGTGTVVEENLPRVEALGGARLSQIMVGRDTIKARFGRPESGAVHKGCDS